MAAAAAAALIRAVIIGAVASTIATSVAFATFPGRNGDIAVVRWPSQNCQERCWPQIWLVRPDGTHARTLTDTPTLKADPAFSADGTRIVFAHRHDYPSRTTYSHISVMDADGRHRHQLTHARADDVSPSFSRDGRRIAFARDGAIYVMRADGSHKRLVTPRGTAPQFSPDGRRIAFEGWDTKPGDAGTPREKRGIFVVNADGSGRRELTRDPTSAPDPAGISDFFYLDQEPRFAPDGHRIVFMRFRNQCLEGDVYTMRANGHDVRPVTRSDDPHCNRYTHATFSPDGRSIAATSYGHLHVMHADGTHVRTLPGFHDDGAPDWGVRAR